MTEILRLPHSERGVRDDSARLLDVVVWTFMVTITVFGLTAAVYLPGTAWSVLGLTALVDLGGILVTVLNRRGATRRAVIMFVVSGWLIITFAALLYGGLRTPAAGAYLVMMVVAGLLLDYRTSLLMSVLLSLSVITIAAADQLRLLPAITPATTISPWVMTAITLGAIWAIQLVAIRTAHRSQQSLRERELLLTHVLDILPVGVWFTDRTGHHLSRNQAAGRIWGGGRLVGIDERAEYRGRWLRTGEPVQPHEWASVRAVTRGETVLNEEVEIECFDGTRKVILNSAVPLHDARDELIGGIIVNQDISQLERAYADLRRVEEHSRQTLNSISDGFFTLDRDWRYGFVNPAAAEAIGRKPEDLLGRTLEECFPSATSSKFFETYQHVMETRQPCTFEDYFSPLEAWFEGTVYPSQHGITVIFRNITERKRAEEAEHQRMEMLTALHATAGKLASTLDPPSLARYAAQACVEVLGAEVAWIGMARSDGTIHQIARSPEPASVRHTETMRWKDPSGDIGPYGHAIREGRPATVHDIASETAEGSWREWALEQGYRSVAAFPLTSGGTTFGSLSLYFRRPGFVSGDRADIFQTFAYQTAAALANARLYEETQTRLRQVEALRSIDRAITASSDLLVTSQILLQQALTELRMDAADILQMDPHTLTLTSIARSGFATDRIREYPVRLGEGLPGLAALDHRTLTGSGEDSETDRRWNALTSIEGFSFCAAAPLVSKGDVKGVLEVFCRGPFEPDQDWFEFFETLAGQGAVAFEATSLFDDLKRSNLELQLAYDATIEGWSRALDMRDRDTEGHTQRVTELSVQLARTIGVDDEDLVHLRRGALLHDIGKLGVPDAILHKEGELTEEEWEVMRQHPSHAFEMLYPVRYLRPALDIPFAHHERWDGNGYPRGRKGEQIPLAARIFSVVDVWDALRSDRPYRSAWSMERARAYIRDQAGTQFDPRVVEAFLALDPSTFPTPPPADPPRPGGADIRIDTTDPTTEPPRS